MAISIKSGNDHAAIHVCLISRELQPNYILVIKFRPQIVYIVATSDQFYKDRADYLKAVLERQHIEVVMCAGCPDIQLEKIRDFARSRVLNAIRARFPKQPVVVNVTGGTKPMSIGFYEVFREADAAVVYTDTVGGMLEYWYPNGKQALPIGSLLRIQDIIEVQGGRIIPALEGEIEWENSVAHRADLSSYLAKNVGELQSFIGQMNLAYSTVTNIAGNKLIEAKNNYQLMGFQKSWEKPLHMMVDLGIIERKSNKIRLTSLYAAKYIGGGWLEEWMRVVLEGEDVDEFRTNVSVEWLPIGGRKTGEESAKNEIDSVIVDGNRMLVVEAKTKEIGNKDRDYDVVSRQTSIQYVINKLENVAREAGGIQVTKLFLSAKPIKPQFKTRAKRNKIETVEPNDKGTLDEFLIAIRKWRSEGARHR